jgi:hypothetical protein
MTTTVMGSLTSMALCNDAVEALQHHDRHAGGAVMLGWGSPSCSLGTGSPILAGPANPAKQRESMQSGPTLPAAAVP